MDKIESEYNKYRINKRFLQDTSVFVETSRKRLLSNGFSSLVAKYKDKQKECHHFFDSTLTLSFADKKADLYDANHCARIIKDKFLGATGELIDTTIVRHVKGEGDKIVIQLSYRGK